MSVDSRGRAVWKDASCWSSSRWAGGLATRESNVQEQASGPADVGGGCVGNEHLPRSRTAEGILRVPHRGHDEQRPSVGAAEHAGERTAVQFDAVEDLAAFGHPYAVVFPLGGPDRALGVDADSVRAEAVGEHPPVR